MRRIAPLPLRTIVRLRAEFLRERGETSPPGASPAAPTVSDATVSPAGKLEAVAIPTELPSAVEAAQER